MGFHHAACPAVSAAPTSCMGAEALLVPGPAAPVGTRCVEMNPAQTPHLHGLHTDGAGHSMPR